MYTPPRFQLKDAQLIADAIDLYPFCTLIGKNVISHLPLLREGSAEKFSLLGHMAKMNPQWEDFRENPEVTVLVHGPNCYVTSSWYQDHDVPTWNYLAVHIKGSVRLIDTFEGLTGILRKSTEKFEAGRRNPWTFSLPEDLEDPQKLNRAIGGFEITVDDVQAKMKISQNRSPGDQRRVIDGLRAERPDDNSRLIADLMEKKSFS